MSRVELTTSRVNRAGRILRRWPEQHPQGAAPDVREALDVVAAFRAAHELPLAAVRDVLRAVLLAEGCPVDVSERLKRTDTIVDKLRRQPSMALARMQDIGGCRAVVATIADLRRVQARLVRELEPVSADDYVARPRPSGYRAVHLVARVEGRHMEVQLRTRRMHRWAATVEELAIEWSPRLKNDEGPPAVKQWLRLLADVFAREDEGGQPDAALLTELDRLRAEALRSIRGSNP